MLDLKNITQAIVFGDSLSDNGNSFALTLGIIPPPPYANGRFSNGIVAVEYLAQNLGLTLNPYYDDGDGNNFAVGGARTGTGNSNNDDIAQIPLLSDVTLPGLANQIDAFEYSLNNELADPDALYVVWAGPNDFLDYLGGSIVADPAVLIESGVSNFVDGATRLADLGAKNIVMPNMPSLGRLPFSSTFPDEATAISRAFNGGLSLALGNLDLVSDSVDPEIVEVDIFAAMENIIADPDSFGLNNVTDPLFLEANPTTPGFFFWDFFHPTTEVHRSIADTISETISGEIPQPTFNNIVGTAKSDFLFGTRNADNIDGSSGHDLIFGGRGDDRIEGDRGNDWLFGGRGHDIINGGNGRDYAWGGAGDDLIFGGRGKDSLFGNRGNDILIGGKSRDYLWGGANDDYVLGGGGRDELYGNRGDDILNGGSGNDLIRGDLGDDLIDGGAGRDTLFGDRGSDIFELTPDFGTDRIADFQLGSDRLMLVGSLSFSDLSFSNEEIIVTATNRTLAIVSGFDTTTLTEVDFV